MKRVKSKKKKIGENKLFSKKGIKAYFQDVDYVLVAILLLIIAYGLIMLYSTSYYSAKKDFDNDMYYFSRQVTSSILGFCVLFGVSLFSTRIIRKFSRVLIIIACILMLLVQTPLGVEAYGARRWLKVPIVNSIQPTEVTKIAIILFIPALICKYGKKINQFKYIRRILAAVVITGLIALLANNHLSSAIIITVIVATMIFVVHKKTAIFVAGAGLGIVGLYGGAVLLGNYLEKSGNFRIARVLVWLHPEKHTESGGYQILQGLYAIGSGGFFGKGLGNSTQKLGVIPEVQNDMILAIICEELGVVGVIALLAMFSFLLYRLLKIIRNAPDTYSALVVTGVFTHIALQVILNMCVILNVMPTTGITLPFISCGGSSIIFIMCEMGVVLGISNRINREARKRLVKEYNNL